MVAVMIGMDPHKRSATIEVMAGDETVLGGGRYRHRRRRLSGDACVRATVPGADVGDRGLLGYRPAYRQPTVGDGEQVLDVPPKLSARMRMFATGQGRKTDATDAHSVALVGTRMSGLRPVVERRAARRCCGCWSTVAASLGEDHTRMVSQLHQLLLELIPGRGEEGSVGGAGQSAAGHGPSARRRRQDPTPGRRGADQRPRADLRPQEGREQGTQRAAQGDRHHADRPARDRPLRRCSSARRGRRHHPLPVQGPLRVLERHRADRRLLRRPGPPSPLP